MKKEKLQRLGDILRKYKKIAVAYSGGLDSTFLLAMARKVLGKENVIALTIASSYMPRWEVVESLDIAKSLDVEHYIVMPDIPGEMLNNPEHRCYICKKKNFHFLQDYARKKGFLTLVDGTNSDDEKDFRPGLKALEELKIKSPLREAGLTKEEIRKFSRKMNLVTWNKPAYACLLTRIPYGERVKEEDLLRIESSERFLMKMGIRAVRVRIHGKLARIEVAKEDFKKILDEELLRKVNKELKLFGFKYVTLDCGGYHTNIEDREI